MIFPADGFAFGLKGADLIVSVFVLGGSIALSAISVPRDYLKMRLRRLSISASSSEVRGRGDS
jgi:hypothetical protein